MKCGPRKVRWSRARRGNRQAGRQGQAAEAVGSEPKQSQAKSKSETEDQSSVHITARTDDGRRVTFRHDEIRDWHDNIRIDYGYAMTIASAQGLTVDRAFLLVDDRPSRETIYPAATRHREGIDVYVNRSPLVVDIADGRTEEEADMPVTDSDIRAYLADRWSRSQPKEAALDYIADGAWRDVRERAQLGRAGIETGSASGAASGATRPADTRQGGASEGQGEAAQAHAAANDNAIMRIAQDIRHAVNGWRHGAAVDTFAAERAHVLAAWGELRERVRAEGEAVALSPVFRETLDRHGELMKRAASFRARPQVFERLLAERAGIGEGEIEELGQVHARAGRYLRSVKARAAHAARQDAPAEVAGIGETAAAETAATVAETADEAAAKAVREEHASPRPAAARPPATASADPKAEAEPDWRALYSDLQRDWNDLVARAGEPDLPLLLMDGYEALIARVRSLAGHPDLSEPIRDVLGEVLEYHQDETAAQETAEGYLAAAERLVEVYKGLERRSEQQGVPVAHLDVWPRWREAAEMLAATGEAILADEEKYGTYLDAMTLGKSRARLTVRQLRNRLHENRVEALKSAERQPQREPAPRPEQGFAHTLDEPRKPQTRPKPADEGQQQGFAHTLFESDELQKRPSQTDEDQQQGFAHLLDDPEKLRELLKKAEKRERKLGRNKRWSRGRSM